MFFIPVLSHLLFVTPTVRHTYCFGKVHSDNDDKDNDDDNNENDDQFYKTQEYNENDEINKIKMKMIKKIT